MNWDKSLKKGTELKPRYIKMLLTIYKEIAVHSEGKYGVFEYLNMAKQLTKEKVHFRKHTHNGVSYTSIIGKVKQRYSYWIHDRTWKNNERSLTHYVVSYNPVLDLILVPLYYKDKPYMQDRYDHHMLCLIHNNKGYILNTFGDMLVQNVIKLNRNFRKADDGFNNMPLDTILNTLEDKYITFPIEL